ncbi:hypothetical protein HGB13_04170 [bacterium]|nr:hypothetical protein [bacterium]
MKIKYKFTTQHRQRISAALTGKKRPEEVKLKVSKTMKERGVSVGKNNPMWRGGSPKLEYNRIHKYLRDLGEQKRCENREDNILEFKCTSVENKQYDYALINGKKHAKKRKNYIMLCPSCHKRYDKTYLNFKRVKTKI